jgi:amino acid adenylation domain-containing protein/non-ribosomal peptide synthase protein (TIGR01720 family)
MNDLANRLARLSPEKRALLDLKRKDIALPVGVSQVIQPRRPALHEPLSFAQQRLWFLSQLEPASAFYNIAEAIRIEGPMSLPHLNTAVSRLMDRHEILRTRFLTVAGVGVQKVLPTQNVEVPVTGINPASLSERDALIRSIAREEARVPFDLPNDPPLRVRVLRLAEDDHIVLLTIHHIASDGWSMGILIRELSMFYLAARNGESDPLPPLPVQYADFAVHQRIWLQGDTLARNLDYWKSQFEGDLPVLDLPLDRPRPAFQRFEGAHETRIFSPVLHGEMKELCRSEGVTPFMLSMAAFQVLINRYTNQRDIVVGTPIAGRLYPELEPLIGFFVNTIAIRTKLESNDSFRSLLRQVRRTSLGAFQHQSLPFEVLIDELHLTRSTSQSPLFQTMFVFQNIPPKQPVGVGLRITPFPLASESAKFDLTMSMAEGRQGLSASLNYNVDLFERDTIVRMLASFEAILETALAAPDRPLNRLNLLPRDERTTLLTKFCGPRDDPGYIDVIEQFERQAFQTPDAIALDGPDCEITYSALFRRVEQIAAQLRDAGAGADSCVAVPSARTIEFVTQTLAVLKAGAAYVPLDLTLPRQRRETMLADLAAAGLAVLRSDSPAKLPTEAASFPPADPEQLSYIVFTSGSSGVPKGVMVTRGALSRRVTAQVEKYGIGSAHRMLQSVAPSFDAFAEEVFPVLCAGGTLILAGDEIDTLDACRRYAANALHMTAALSAPVYDSFAAGRNNLAHAIDLFIVGGDRTSPDQLRKWAHLAPQSRWMNAYGPSEATITAAVWEAPLNNASELESLWRIPIGRPLPNTQVYVLDQEMEPLPTGAAGELYIGGACLARGYLNRPDQTAASFVPDPFGAHGGRLYRTGDLARFLPNGNLEFLGRKDQQVKIRGYRIELAEIESALRACPGIADAVVDARQLAPGDKRLVAYFVAAEEPVPSTVLSSGDLRRWLKDRLPEYMIPSAFIALTALPRNAHGKLDRDALPPPAWGEAEPDAGAEPSTDAEKILAGIWSEVLRVPHAGIHQNFFELGGDSILSIQIVARAQTQGLRITVKQLFQHQTIAELAAVAEHCTTADADSSQAPVSGSVELTPIQQWFFEQNWNEPWHFNQAVLLNCVEPLNEDGLRAAVAALVHHHDALRTRFQFDPGEWLERLQETIAHSAHDALVMEQVSGSAELEERAAHWQKQFDLTSGLLLRVVLFRMSRGETDRVLLIAHHLVVDGVSWRILLEDLEHGYAQWRQSQEIELPAKTASFQRWAAHLKQQATSPAVEAEWPYWEQQCASDQLPDNRAEPEQIATVSLQLDEEATRALLQDVPPVYGTQINDALLTALTEALGTDGQLTVELEGHGRDETAGLNITRTVGWFTVQYPIRLDTHHTGDIADKLKSTKEQLRSVPGGGLGYGLLRYCGADLERRKNLRHRPKVSFNYLGQLDSTLPRESLFQAARENKGPTRSAGVTLTNDFIVTANVMSGRLRVWLTYNAAKHQAEEVEAVASRFTSTLHAIVEHCHRPDSGGYTPSDFPLAKLAQHQLDRWFPGRRHIEDIYPLSPMQQGLLFHTLYQPGSGVYLEQMSCTLEGDLDLAAFQKAWNKVMERHAILRTSFLWEGLDEPLQIVHKHVTLPLTFEDWTSIPKADRPDLNRILHADRKRDFDMGTAPLMRISIIRLDSKRHFIIWAFHHALQDGWSGPILFQEVFVCYEAFRTGKTPQLARTRPYRDYIAWLARQDRSAIERYWRKELAGFTAPTPLGLDLPDSEPASGVLEFTLTEAQTTLLTEQLRRSQLTLNTLMQGAWALLLRRYSGNDEVVFGLTVSGRPPELEGMENTVGLFINTLPVRVRVNPEGTVRDWLQQLQLSQSEARQYDHTPLTDVQQWSDVPRGTPLFQSIIGLQNYGSRNTQTDRKSNNPFRDVVVHEKTNYPINLLVMPRAQLTLHFTHDERVSHAVIARMGEHLAILMPQLAASLSMRLGLVDFLTLGEQRQMEDWNATDRPRPETTVVQLFQKTAEQKNTAVALASASGSLTYGELNSQANRLAHYLLALHVGPETFVGICVERSPAMIVSILAVLKAGAAYVPLDPTYPPDRLQFILKDAAAPVLIAREDHIALFPSYSGKTVLLDRHAQIIDTQPSADPSSPSLPDHAAYAIYTSGSTGRPKGVVATHRGLLNFTLAGIEDHTPIRSFLLLSSFAFDSSLCGIFWTLCQGGTLCLPPGDLTAAASRLPDLIRTHRISHLLCIPSLFEVLLDSDPTDSLDTVIVAGEACSPSIVQKQRERLPTTHLSNEYGPTEGTCWSTTFDASQCTAGKNTPIGKPIANTRVFLLDENGCRVPVGVAGELYISGVHLARGYWQRPDTTAELFVPDPFSETPGARLYRTGDLARFLPSGDLEFLGRKDGQVKIRGHRIELSEIDSVLSECPQIRQAVTSVHESVTGERSLRAHVVLNEAGHMPNVEQFARAKLPDYMVPATFVSLPHLPALPNGKIDRAALERLETPAAPSSRKSPTDSVEHRLTALWKDIFHIPEVSVDDHFFKLGGHSLLAVGMVTRINREFGLDLPVSVVFEAPVLEELARRIRGPAERAPSSLITLQASGGRPPLYCVHPRGLSAFCYSELANRLGPDQPLFAFEPFALHADCEPHRTIESMASEFVRQLRQHRPSGNFRLCGWSMGGTIAFEMARQLRLSGQPVDLLALLDTYAEIPEDEEHNDAASLLRNLGRSLDLPVQTFHQMSAGEQRDCVINQARAAGVDENLLSRYEKSLSIWQAQGDAIRRYRVSEYDGDIVFFRARDRESLDPSEDWQRISPGRFIIHDVPGSHNTILKPPFVAQLAEAMSPLLQNHEPRTNN